MADLPSDPREQVRELAWSLCAGMLEPAQYGRLEELLTGDVELRREYLRQMRLVSDCQVLAMPECLVAAGGASADRASLPPSEAVLVRQDEFDGVAATGRRPIGWFRRPISAIERPVAWSIMAVAVCFYGTFAFLAWNLRAPAGSSRPTDGETAVAHVGRMAEVEWAASSATRIRDSAVARGEPMKIAGGVVEIRLRRGALLIVEGPAEWSIDGDNLATLHRGKVVARVPQRAVGFALRTPTAEIVDLGTEFGVEVGSNRAASVAVFEGEVHVRSTVPSAATTPLRLVRGQGVVVSEQTQRLQPTMVSGERFVRSISQRLPATGESHEIVVWYRLGEDDGSLTSANSVPTSVADPRSRQAPPLQLEGQLQATDDVAAPGSSRAVRFDPEKGVRSATTTGIRRLEDNFVLEAWVRPDRLANACLVYHGSSAADGYGLFLFDGQWMGVLGSKAMLASGVACELGRWTHLALVRENGRARIFVDGSSSDSVWLVDPNIPTDVFSIGGFAGRSDEIFSGDIDEVRLMQLRRLFDPELLLCK